MHRVKFTIFYIELQLTGIKHVHIAVRPPPPSSPRILPSPHTETSPRKQSLPVLRPQLLAATVPSRSVSVYVTPWRKCLCLQTRVRSTGGVSFRLWCHCCCLPVTLQVSTKPQWQEAAPSFHLNIKQEEEIPELFSVKNEQSYGKGVNRRTQIEGKFLEKKGT